METVEKNVLPHSTEAEMSVLGAMLLGQEDATDEAIAALNLSDFYLPRHGDIFAAMTSVRLRREPLDIITLRDQMQSQGKLDACGGIEYLMQLGDMEFTVANLPYYTRIVAEKSALRHAVASARRIVADALTEKVTATQIADGLSRAASDMTDWCGASARTRTLRQIAHDHAAILQSRYERGGEIPGIITGLTAIDRMSGGLRRKNLFIIAARPSMGKTAFVGTVALNVAKQGYGVGVFSLEMAEEEIHDRWIAAVSGVNSQAVETGRFADSEEFQRVMDSNDYLAQLRLAVDDTSSLPISQLESRCRKMRAEMGRLDVVVVDYLQIMQGMEGKRYGREDEMLTDIAEGLKRVAKNLNVCVLACAQLSRQTERRGSGDFRPILSDLRGSGGIEQAADTVSFLYRPSYYAQESGEQPEPGDGAYLRDETEFIIGKNRKGRVGTVKIGFAKALCRFDNLAEGVL
jgi:replicative DNA helicase